MAGQGIVHTTQAGEGDAVIFGRESRLSPIDNILNLGAQKQKAKAQSALLKQKLSNDNQQGFYKQLQDIRSKVWDADLPEVNKQIDDLVKFNIDAQKNGVDPFSDVAHLAENSGRLAKIEAYATSGILQSQKYSDGLKAISKGKIGDDDINVAESIKSYNDWKNLPKEERSITEPQIVYAPIDTEKILGKQYDGNIKALVATYGNDRQDKKLSEDATKIMRESLRKMELEAYTKLQPWVDRGMITPEDAATKIRSYFSKNDDLATLYDKTVDENQSLAIRKQNEVEAYHQKLYDLASKKFQFTKSMSEIKNTEVDDLFNSIIGGLPVSTSALAGQDIRNPKTNEIVKTGTFEPIRDANGKITGIKIATYKAVTNPETQEVTLQPAGYINSPLVSKEGKPIYSTTQIYQSKFANSVKSKTPATNYFLNDNNEFEIIDENQQTVGARKTNSEGNSGSTYDKTATQDVGDLGGIPKKEETVTYVLNGKSGVIPKSQEAAFIKKYPKAKKM